MFQRYFFCILISLFIGCGEADSTKNPKINPPAEQEGMASTKKVHQQIGVSGGKLSLGSISLTIPEGALKKDENIEIQQITEPIPEPWMVQSPRYQFRPEGLLFAKPVELKISFKGPPSLATLYWSDEDEAVDFVALPSTVNGQELVGHIYHFSRGFVGFKLVPPPQSNSSPCEGMTIWQQQVAANSETVADFMVTAPGLLCVVTEKQAAFNETKFEMKIDGQDRVLIGPCPQCPHETINGPGAVQHSIVTALTGKHRIDLQTLQQGESIHVEVRHSPWQSEFLYDQGHTIGVQTPVVQPEILVLGQEEIIFAVVIKVVRLTGQSEQFFYTLQQQWQVLDPITLLPVRTLTAEQPLTEVPMDSLTLQMSWDGKDEQGAWVTGEYYLLMGTVNLWRHHKNENPPVKLWGSVTAPVRTLEIDALPLQLDVPTEVVQPLVLVETIPDTFNAILPEDPCITDSQKCQDQDGDGVTVDLDCDDQDSQRHPLAKEQFCDGIDQNCNGFDECDQDQDGILDTFDCDPANSAITIGCLPSPITWPWPFN